MTKTRLARQVHSPDPGVLLLPGVSLRPIAYNREALQILAFPNSPEDWRRPASDLARQIGAKLAPTPAKGSRTFVPVFKSGNRTYLCRALTVGLEAGRNGSRAPATTLILLERQALPQRASEQNACDQFGLSHRERQMVGLLVKGMTTKEMATALTLSPNTIKSFLRLIMAKMGVSTRSGIVGKLVESNRP